MVSPEEQAVGTARLALTNTIDADGKIADNQRAPG